MRSSTYKVFYLTGIFVMGYGLVAIPKQLWRTASIRGKERLLQHRAGVQAEKTLAARRSACLHSPLPRVLFMTPNLLLMAFTDPNLDT